ncbi:NAD(P)-dependent oxidoreductase [Microvirga sp. KLBC 81]|uniref:NAD(P)-dependent oxidoreductase n=1 Tax=Microvirga sp. KLBC 81 TaxID=1862707 RepID=UPI001402CE90|nr:NAD(P)-dependent oxidoreductase [Microvirga sp. KLBC 81]
MTTRTPTLGYIGLGKMGSPMVMRLLSAGLPVHVWARNPDRLGPMLQAGATASSSPRDLAENAEIIFTCLSDTAAVEEVVLGPEGISAAQRSRGILVDMSTVSPDATIRMAAELKSRCGREWMDAPVSGGTTGAQAGTLTIMVGGSSANLGRVRPFLDHLGKRITLMGDIGSGQTTKLINQTIVACTMMVLAEALGLAKRTGLDVAALPAALAGGRADSTMLQHLWPRMVENDFAPTGTIQSMVKDLKLVQSLGQAVHAAMPITAIVAELHQWLMANGFADEDLTSAYRIFRPIGNERT